MLLIPEPSLETKALPDLGDEEADDGDNEPGTVVVGYNRVDRTFEAETRSMSEEDSGKSVGRLKLGALSNRASNGTTTVSGSEDDPETTVEEALVLSASTP